MSNYEFAYMVMHRSKSEIQHLTCLFPPDSCCFEDVKPRSKFSVYREMYKEVAWRSGTSRGAVVLTQDIQAETSWSGDRY